MALVAFGLNSCSGGGTVKGGGGPYNIKIDGISPVPLINGNQQDFEVYFTNISKYNARGLVFSLNSVASSSVPQSLLSRIKDKFSPKALSTSGVSIVNSSCSEIAAGNSCALRLRGVLTDNVKLSVSGAVSGTSEVASLLIGTYNYNVPATVPSDGVLTITPLTEISATPGVVTGYSFFIINNGTSAVSIPDDNFLGTLPNGVSYNKLETNCSNPLPGGTACQVRLVLNVAAGATLEAPLNLVPRGSTVDNAGNKTPLPTQGSYSVNASTQLKGIASLGTPDDILVTSNDGVKTVTGVISNTGRADLVINTVSTTSSALSVSASNCIGKTLKVGEYCSYIASVTGTGVTGGGSGVVTVVYNNSLSTTLDTKAIAIKWKYTLISSLPAITASSISGLSLTNPTATLTITNSGDVALLTMIKPTVTVGTVTAPSLSTVSVGDATGCTFPLAVGASCSYVLTYNPKDKQNDTNTTAAVGGVSVTYLEDDGSSAPAKTLLTNVSFTLNSVYAGNAVLSNDNVLVESITLASKFNTITIRNKGNNDSVLTAPLLALGLNSRLVIDASTTCTGGKILLAKVGNTEDSCIIVTKLNPNNTTAGTGSEVLNLTYNNNNGQVALPLTSNITWNIGENPILDVTFANSNLTTKVGSTATTEITLENKGNTLLNNITLPTSLTAGLSLSASATNGCVIASGKINSLSNVVPNNTCKLTLTYAPTALTPTYVTNLGNAVAINNESVFSYMTTLSPTLYTNTNPSLTLNAVNNGVATDFVDNITSSAITSISQTNSWVAGENESTIVKFKNVSTRDIILTGASTTDSTKITTSFGSGGTNCQANQVLSANTSCYLTITNSYGVSTNGSGNVTVNYTESGIALSDSIALTVIGVSKPVIIPSLVMSILPSNVSFVSNDGVSESQELTITLTNNTTALNSTQSSDTKLKVSEASLLVATTTPANQITLTSANASNTNSNACVADTITGKITVLGGTSCTYKVLSYAQNNTLVTNSSVTISPSYESVVYLDTSITGGTRTDATSTQGAFNYTVSEAAVSLSAITAVISPANPSLQVESQTGAYVVKFSVQNTGAGNLAGNISIDASTPLPSGFVADLSACNGLKAGESCEFNLTMSTSSVIAAGNLSAISIAYNSLGTPAPSVALPSTPYEVYLGNSAVVGVSIKVDNCMNGDFKTTSTRTNLSTTPLTCNINTGNNPAPVIHVIFKNTGLEDANNFAVDSAALATAITGKSYNQTIVNTCTSTLIASTGECELTINPDTTNATVESQTGYDIMNNSNNTTVSYSYTYGPQNRPVTPPAVNVGMDANIVTPQLSVPTGTLSVLKGNTAGSALTITVSSWYSLTPPTGITFSYIDSLLATATGFTSTTCTMNTPASSSSSCTVNVAADSTVASGNYTMGITGTDMVGAIKAISVVALFRFSSPFDIIISGSYGYITNSSISSVTKCSYASATGDLTACVNANVSGLNGPYGITISGSYGYITNYGNSTVTKCSYASATGSLTACADSGVTGLSGPTGITISGINAYILNRNSNTVTRCVYDSATGSLTSCVNANVSGLSSPRSMTISGSYGYITNLSNNIVTKCSYDSATGSLTSCADSGVTGLSGPAGITISGINAYISNRGNSTVTKCSYASATGDLSNCVGAITSGLNQPYGITISGSYGYIVNYITNSVTKCSYASATGDLSNCGQTGSAP